MFARRLNSRYINRIILLLQFQFYNACFQNKFFSLQSGLYKSHEYQLANQRQFSSPSSIESNVESPSHLRTALTNGASITQCSECQQTIHLKTCYLNACQYRLQLQNFARVSPRPTASRSIPMTTA